MLAAAMTYVIAKREAAIDQVSALTSRGAQRKYLPSGGASPSQGAAGTREKAARKKRASHCSGDLLEQAWQSASKCSFAESTRSFRCPRTTPGSLSNRLR